jgi:hypothetical protein
MTKFFVRAILCLALAAPVSGAAQQPGASDVPDKADVLKFLDLMHAKAQMAQALDGMTKQIRLGAEQGFREKVPDATPEQLAKVDHLFDGLFKSFPLEEMEEAVVPVYQKHLTKSDLAAIIAFYSSPAGQKVLNEMPAIMSESMQVGGEIGRKMFSAKSQEFDQKLAELVEASKKQ